MTFFLEGISFNVCVDQLDFEVGFGDYSDNDDDLLLGDRIEDGGNKTGAGVEDAMYRKKGKYSQPLDDDLTAESRTSLDFKSRDIYL